MQRTLWIERKFHHDFPPGLLPNMLVRLRGTTLRLKEMVKCLSASEITYKPNQKWSIAEQIGHLADLEDLHLGRIDDFLQKKDVLRAADMANVKTHEAGHQAKSAEQLIREFDEKRNRLIAAFENLNDDIQDFQSLHPRLGIMMRPVDMAYFTAEHDDHHLVSIREIVEGL